MERKQVQFTRAQLAAIRKEASRRRTSDAEIVRQAVDQLLTKSRTPARRSARIARAMGAVGRFGSGRRRTSREHDRDLADAFAR